MRRKLEGWREVSEFADENLAGSPQILQWSIRVFLQMMQLIPIILFSIVNIWMASWKVKRCKLLS